MDETRARVELVARESYGRLSRTSRRERATWPRRKMRSATRSSRRWAPGRATACRAKPEAWLLTTARRRLIDRARHDRVRTDAAGSASARDREKAEATTTPFFPDERLKLLFVCAHPAIDRGVHTPLMLQVVLGLDAATIARAFLSCRRRWVSG